MGRKTQATAQEYNRLGATFYQAGAIDLAIEQFKIAARRAPWISSYWLNLGAALLDKAMLDEAESALNRAVSLNPESQSAYYHIAQLQKMRGDEKAVRLAYEKTIELDPYTYLAQRARERLEGWRPRFIIAVENESKVKKSGE